MQATGVKILGVLSIAQMCKFFSHFGFRTLLMLYMVEHLKYADSHAFGVNAVFCGLSELGGIFGGIIADRYLGLKKGMLLGGWLLSLGYSLCFFEGALFLSMGLVIAGSSLFSGNITALLGLAYSENDPNRKMGFTIFYMMQNLGAFGSILLCGFIAIHYTFSLAFIVASMGAIIGNVILFIYRKLFDPIEMNVQKKERLIVAAMWCVVILVIGAVSLWAEKIVLYFLPWLTGGIMIFFVVRLLQDKRWIKDQVYVLAIYLGALILFFAAEDQICSSLVLFSERETKRLFFGWTLPSSLITSINPMIILLMGTFIAKRKSQMITPFMLTAFSFGILAIVCLLHYHCSILGVMGVVVIISLSELMIGPLVLSKASEIAAKGSSGMIMGLLPIAFSLAYQLSGSLGKMVAIEEHSLSLQVYGTGFGLVALLLLFGGVMIQLLIRKFDGKYSICKIVEEHRS